jgi:hypothetical protein
MVDANIKVTCFLAWLFWEPVLFLMCWSWLLQNLAECLGLLLSWKPFGAEDLGDTGHGSVLTSHHSSPGVEGMHGNTPKGREHPHHPPHTLTGFLTDQIAMRKRGCEERMATIFPLSLE